MKVVVARTLPAAGLDSREERFDVEPRGPAELVALPNTVLVPHIGSATRVTRDAMAALCADNVIAVLTGREPPSAIIQVSSFGASGSRTTG